MNCVATVRGALEPLDGIRSIDVKAGEKPFTVEHTTDVTAEEIAAAVRKAGEEVEVKDEKRGG